MIGKNLSRKTEIRSEWSYEKADANVAAALDELRGNLAPMEKQEKALDTIDSVVGRPTEKEIPLELLVPAPTEWNFFPKAGDDKILEMCESIDQYGLFHNITVWEQGNGTYMILGGHTRYACYEHLWNQADVPEEKQRWAKIPSLVYAKEQISEIDAKRIIIVSNTDQRDISAATKSRAYMNLFQLEREKAFYGSRFDPLASAASQADTSKTVFFRYLSLLKLIPELQDDVSNGKTTLMAGYHLSFLPKKLQQYVYDNGIHEKITTKAAAELKECTTVDALKEKLYSIQHATKYYKYSYTTRTRKLSDEEVLPIIVDKGLRNDIADMYIKAVSQSDFPDDVKSKLTQAMREAKI